jgi:tight adherence protein C
MPIDLTSTIAIFVMGCTLVLLLALIVGGRRSRLDDRLGELAEHAEFTAPVDAKVNLAKSTLPKMGAILLPRSEADQTKLQSRLIHAGLYGRQALALYLGVKLLLIALPPLIGLGLAFAGVLSMQKGLIFGAVASGLGIVAPSFWLDSRKAARQTSFRRALPDALDVLVICLEGGASLPSALQRVAGELQTAHPMLATELHIVQREIQLGRSAGEALRQFANRSDLEEIRSLASVVQQSERFGASLVKALRVHAETLRGKRILQAEEMAQKAVVKLLFPTALCIMPALFIVIIGPLALEAVAVIRGLGR